MRKVAVFDSGCFVLPSQSPLVSLAGPAFHLPPPPLPEAVSVGAALPGAQSGPPSPGAGSQGWQAGFPAGWRKG